MKHLKFKYLAHIMLTLKLALVGWMLWLFFQDTTQHGFALDTEFFIFFLIGFGAQLIDGTLGMAYGVSCSTCLLHMGVSPAIASASVHTAEVFTTGVSGLSHLYMKNVDKRLFVQLAIPGMIGAILGSFLLARVFNGDIIKPIIAAYLLILGIVIIIKSFRPLKLKDQLKKLAPLGFVGGLCDAIGGGGWGPIVTSNIIKRGKSPQIAIGTVNTAEFFVAFFSTGVFLFLLGMDAWKTILGLILGGILSAPVGPLLIKYIRPKSLMLLVGIGIVLTSCYTIYLSIK